MGGHSENRDVFFLRPVTPEDPIGPGSAVLSVGFKHFIFGVEGIINGTEFMSLERGMAGINLKKTERFFDLLFQTDFAAIGFYFPRGAIK